jgi:hypothetical protein
MGIYMQKIKAVIDQPHKLPYSDVLKKGAGCSSTFNCLRAWVNKKFNLQMNCIIARM